jgi:cell division protein FtsB
MKRSRVRRTSVTSSPRPAAERGQSRLADLTRTIPIERRITRRRRSNLIFGVVALGIAGALAITLFIFPVQTYRDQSRALSERARQVEALEGINADLAAEVQRLRTDAGVKEAAREQIGYAEPGEQRLTVLDLPPLPAQLPAGWPYDLITSIITLRSPSAPAPETAPEAGPDAGPEPEAGVETATP